MPEPVRWLLHSSFQALIAGALLPLAFAPFGFFPLAILSPLWLFYLWQQASLKQAMISGWWFGLGLFGVGVSWIFVAINVYAFTPWPLAAFLTFLFVAFLAGFFSLQAYLSVRLRDAVQHAPRWFYPVLVLPACWSLLEWFRGWVLTGFPWLSLGYSQTDSWLSGYAPLLGVYGIGLIVVVMAGLLLSALQYQQYRLFTLFTVLLLWTAGLLLQQVEWSEIKDKPIKVSLIQGNVPQIMKWDPVQFELRKNRYADLTRANWNSQLIVWPENALTMFYHQMKQDYLEPLAKEAGQHGSNIILGLPTLNLESREYYSSLVTLGETEQFYHKNHLVPFGEYVPLGNLIRGLIGFLDLPMSGFSRGGDQQSALFAAGQWIAPTICYEDAFGEELIRFLPKASLLINASNNAWYGDSFAPHQHVQISRMRALETARDMLRVTTNGISALIDYRGKVIEQSPQFEMSVISGEAQPRSGATPYVQMGNYPVLILIGLVVMLSRLYYRRG